MTEEVNIKEVVEEVKNSDEETLQSTVEKRLESVRTQGMKIGAQYVSAGIFGIIKKHLKKASNPSLRDYKRCVEEIVQIISVQLTVQNDLVEENENDGTAE